MALQAGRADQVLAVYPPRRHRAEGSRPPREAALADRARLPRTQRRARPRSLRRPHLPRLEPPRHARVRRTRVPDPGTTTMPANPGGSLTLFAVVRELQTLLACWHGDLSRLPPRAAARPSNP